MITGIRFYKAASNTGTHVGHLWSAGGTLLASAAFTSETASGWQRVSFATPVAIAANTTYVASYHTDVGHYSADMYYFGRSGVDQWPLHALGSTTGSGNGVFAAGTTAGFPTGSYFGANYWVDVVFSTHLVGYDAAGDCLGQPRGRSGRHCTRRRGERDVQRAD